MASSPLKTCGDDEPSAPDGGLMLCVKAGGSDDPSAGYLHLESPLDFSEATVQTCDHDEDGEFTVNNSTVTKYVDGGGEDGCGDEVHLGWYTVNEDMWMDFPQNTSYQEAVGIVTLRINYFPG